MCQNISLVTSDLNKDHPLWNDAKVRGDGLITKLLSLPIEEHRYDAETVIVRPSDFSAWRRVLDSWPSYRENKDRFPFMLSLLEADPDYWIYITV